MNTNMAGFSPGFQMPLRPCALDESSLSIGRARYWPVGKLNGPISLSRFKPGTTETQVQVGY